VVKQKDVNVELVAKLIASVEGMTVSIKVHDGITATVRVDFGMEVTSYKKITRELFLELLDYQGVTINGMSAWETKYTEKSMTLSGTLTDTDMRRVLSLFAFPGAVAEDDPQVKPGEISVPATKRYLAACDTILADLRKQKDTPDYMKSATWNEKAADQLHMLDRRAVDPIAITSAHDTAARLRALAGSLRGVPIDLDALANSAYLYGSSNTGWARGGGRGWWGLRPVWTGGGSLSTNLPQVWAQQEKVIVDDKKRRTEVWIQIDQILADARQKLTDKYKTRF
jgi:hypothetical protein